MFRCPASGTRSVNDADLTALLKRALRTASALRRPPKTAQLLAPIGSQEVWAAGVTYQRSRTARMAESKRGGRRRFLRPRLPRRAPGAVLQGDAAPGGRARRRRCTCGATRAGCVPEPELTLAVDRRGRIFGYTIGNDLELPRHRGREPALPAAGEDVYDGCAALGPGILRHGPAAAAARPRSRIDIRRRGRRGLRVARRSLRDAQAAALRSVEYLFRDNTFPVGCLLMTGTGIVPPGRLHAAPRRRGPHHHRADRHAREHDELRVGLGVRGTAPAREPGIGAARLSGSRRLQAVSAITSPASWGRRHQKGVQRM